MGDESNNILINCIDSNSGKSISSSSGVENNINKESFTKESTSGELEKLKVATELSYNRAMDLINFLGINESFIKVWNEKRETMEKNPNYTGVSHMGIEIDSFVSTYKEFQNKGVFLVYSEYSDKILKELIDYLIVLGEKQNAAEQMAKVLNTTKNIEASEGDSNSFFGRAKVNDDMA